MTGYFSNHSTSRFLASTTSSQPNGTTANTASTATPMSTVATRPRAPSSRHFSTTVSQSSSGDEKPALKEKQVGGGSNGLISESVHPLRNTWVFWFRQQRGPTNKIVNYEEGIKRIASFASVESFWTIWTHLCPPSSVQPTTDYLLFHSGVRRPVWEDPLNLSGGKWIIRLKKGISERLWEELVVAVVGDQFDDCNPANIGGFSGLTTGASDAASWRLSGEAGNGTGALNGTPTQFGNDPEICGCTLSIRQHEDILSVWNKHGFDTRVNNRIRENIKKILELPPNTFLEYKTNNDSLQDKPSIRQPGFDRVPPQS